MNLAIAFIAGPILVACTAPAVLRYLLRHVSDPGALLVAWFCVLGAVLGTFIVGVVLLLVPGAGPDITMGDLARHCWLAARHGRLPAADELIGAIGAFLVLVVLTRFIAAGIRRALAERRARQAHLDLLLLTGGSPGLEGDSVLWIPDAPPLAYSLGGRDGVTVLGAGVRGLPSDQLAAVVTHERAHLKGRHHLLVATAEGLAAAVPWLPLTKHAPVAVRLLVELCADAAAVRTCGAAAVRAAIHALSGAPHPASSLPMAGSEVALRLQQLQDPPCSPHLLARTALAAIALAAPVVVGLAAATAMCT
nr:M56 family metallopeptidase [Micromonospora purpureochromogenes]